MSRKVNEATLTRMWAAALRGDKAAINGLYAQALAGLPRAQGRSADSRAQIIVDAVWQVLDQASDETAGAKRWITREGKVTLPRFKKQVCDEVGKKASEKTVQRFINDPEEMAVIVHLYEKIYGLE